MTVNGWLQIVVFCAALIIVSPFLGRYMAKVYTGERVFLTPVFGGFERLLYRCFLIDPKQEQDWKRYARSLIFFSLAGWIILYVVLRTASIQPWNNYGGVAFHAAPWDVTFNTVSSFLTNTNWQYYGGETTLTYFSQMIGLTVQNFASAAVGIVVAVALVRGIAGRSGKSLGNFYSDLVKTILYVLLPIAFVSALVLISQGSIQNIAHYVSAHGISGVAQTIAMGPVASQEAIKMLGTNGGGFFNVNSAHPFENPNGFTNFYEMFIVLIIPAGSGLDVRSHGRLAPPGDGDLRDDVRDVHRRRHRRLRRRGPRLAGAARRGDPYAGDRRLDRRQPRGQGAALRHRRLSDLRRRHDRHLVRRRQQLDRVIHRPGRRDPVRQPLGQ